MAAQATEKLQQLDREIRCSAVVFNSVTNNFSERPERRPGGEPRRRSSSPRGGGRFGRRPGRRRDRSRRWGSRRCVIISVAHAVDPRF